jgi:hypothetical protein
MCGTNSFPSLAREQAMVRDGTLSVPSRNRRVNLSLVASFRVKEWKRDGKPAHMASDGLPASTIDRFHEP